MTTSQADRQIKFWAWDGEKMIYPDGHKYVLRFDGTIGKFDEIIKQYHTEEWKLLQFTGLLDKNGKEIYEHDILALMDANGKTRYTYTVKFEDGKFVLYHTVKHYGKWGDLHRAFEPDFHGYHMYVIGNVYANSNLLQG